MLHSRASAAVMPPHRDANGGPVWIEYRKFNRLSRIYLFSFRLEIGHTLTVAACRWTPGISNPLIRFWTNLALRLALGSASCLCRRQVSGTLMRLGAPRIGPGDPWPVFQGQQERQRPIGRLNHCIIQMKPLCF